MVEKIFASLPGLFVAGAVNDSVSYYFSLGEIKKTVKISSDDCSIEDGKTIDKADCVCKTSQEFFLRIWDDGYRPKMGDFLSGTIKSNNPSALQGFLKSFGKES